MSKFSLSIIRNKWIDFFVKKNHYHFPSQSLVPKDDDSLLWINSGVATLKKYFLGLETAPSKKIVNSQRCIRTNDVENVGVTSRHHTFFEMLGNFSIGDYFRKEAIEYAFEFITTCLEMPVKKLFITVFEEDNDSYELWIKLGIPKDNIIKCDKSRNFWEIGKGPCGPCTEIYYDRGLKYDPHKKGTKLFYDDIENDRYIEIWNIVFSEFDSNGAGEYKPLLRKNIDTGAGLERLACILQDVPTNYDIDSFVLAKNVIEKFSSYKYNKDLYFEKNKDELIFFTNKCFNVLVDHFKACIFAIGDGAIPSNKGRGYIIRKLLRRCFIFMDYLNIKDSNFIKEFCLTIASTMWDYYPDLKNTINETTEVITKEQDFYQKSLVNSLKHLNEIISTNKVNSHSLFKLVDTYGFPIEIIKELEVCNNQKIIDKLLKGIGLKNKTDLFKKENINFEQFNDYMDEHKNISKAKVVSGDMNNENLALIDLKDKSIFVYEDLLLDAKILKIFDINFKEVESVSKKDCYLLLDKTCFYATSGGQLNDLGTIDNFNVTNVFKIANGQHIHKVDNATFKKNQNVKLVVDSLRRNLLSKNHSVEHLLHAVLKKNISESIKQEGAYKSPEKVTFDFYYHKKLSIEEIKKIEDSIKKIINQKIPVTVFEKTIEEAKKMGALAYFENVYKKISGKLRVIKMGDASTEICGGTHVKNTSEIEDFKIIKLDSKGSGSWRIEAITSNFTVKNFNENVFKEMQIKFQEFINEYKSFKIKDQEIEEIIKSSFQNLHFIEVKNLMDLFKTKLNILKAKVSKNKAVEQANTIKQELTKNQEKINFISLDNYDGKTLFYGLVETINEVQDSIYVVFNKVENLFQYYVSCNEQYSKNKNIDLKKVALIINENLLGKGGGKPNFVQGSFSIIDDDKIKKTIDKIKLSLK